MLSDQQIEKAKQANLPALMRQRQLNLIPMNGGDSFKTNCPFHEDKTPSLNMSFKDGLWLFNCFGCGVGGSAIDFVKRLDKVDFKEAVASLTAVPVRSPLAFKIKPSQPMNNNPQKRFELLTAVSEYYHQNLLDSKKSIKAREYLKKRGLLDEHLIKQFKLGYSTGDLQQHFKESRALLRQELGLFKSNYHETFANSVVIPVIGEAGQVSDLYARRTINYTDRANHCYNKGSHLGLFNTDNLQKQKIIILTESMIDALSVFKAGYKNVTCLYGVNGFTASHEQLFKKDVVEKALCFFDNDKAGRSCLERVKERLVGVDVVSVKYPGNLQDPNQILMSLGEGFLKQMIEQALPAKTSTLQATTVQQEGRFKTQNTDLFYQVGELVYRVKGALALKNTNTLRLVVSVFKDGENLTDKVDFYTSRSRQSFTNLIKQKLQVAVDIEKHLQSIAHYLEKHIENRDREPLKQVVLVNPTQEQDALAFLKSARLVDQILADLSTLGYVGEDDNKLLLYLSATSRKLKKPISVLIRSQSSTGKSFMIKTICSCMPGEDVLHWTSASEQALYYMPSDGLKHKFIAIDEQQGGQDLEYPIRSLQSEGRLSRAVPIKDIHTGELVTQQMTKEGPVAYVDGSTDTNVNPENANRCFEIFLDETFEQTLRVQASQRSAHSLEGWEQSSQAKTICARHQNAQRLLKPIKVIIPYIKLVQFPSEWIRTRRDHARFLSLIESISFLHQHQRPNKQSPFSDDRYIEASLDDYALAYHLASKVLFQTFHDLEKPLLDFYRQLEKLTKTMNEDAWFSRRDVRAFTKLPDYLVKRSMRRLSDLEYFEIKKGSQGSRFLYRLVRHSSNESALKGLTTPKELQKSFSMTQTPILTPQGIEAKVGQVEQGPVLL